ncbi:hypothetical protein I7I51_02347 [Histoplasma capsulatum]|uniref:Uncharacterized protein n=1 Tax=Ajellomyces capsulatus TaxID=5037 RepID=A0A8A1M7W9_AJECA|nr:hypothetical protein I7I51_02347 [Histoplasma capsulatum]
MESTFDTQQDHEGAIMMASLSRCAHSSPVARIADGSNVSSGIFTLRQRIEVDMLLGTQLKVVKGAVSHWHSGQMKIGPTLEEELPKWRTEHGEGDIGANRFYMRKNNFKTLLWRIIIKSQPGGRGHGHSELALMGWEREEYLIALRGLLGAYLIQCG